MNNYEKAIELLKEYNQKHVITIMEKLEQDKKDRLVEQILKIDFNQLKELYKMTFEDLYVDLEQLEPIRGVNPDKLSKEQIEEYENIGNQIITENKFAVATMAGGQGTRLRTSFPKRYIQN